MRLALTTSGATLEGPLEPLFGRAPRSLVYDTDTKEGRLRVALEGAGRGETDGRERRGPVDDHWRALAERQ